MQNPPVNALGYRVRQGLMAAFNTLRGDPAIKAVVLTGSDSTLELYAQALRLRRQLQGAEELEWVTTTGDVLHFRRPGGWECAMNFGVEPVPLPAGQVVLSTGTGPVSDLLPGETTVWLTRPRPA